MFDTNIVNLCCIFAECDTLLVTSFVCKWNKKGRFSGTKIICEIFFPWTLLSKVATLTNSMTFPWIFFTIFQFPWLFIFFSFHDFSMTFHDSFFFHDFPGFSMTVGTLYRTVFVDIYKFVTATKCNVIVFYTLFNNLKKHICLKAHEIIQAVKAYINLHITLHK